MRRIFKRPMAIDARPAMDSLSLGLELRPLPQVSATAERAMCRDLGLGFDAGLGQEEYRQRMCDALQRRLCA